MANLIIDIGNTAVKAAWSDSMTLGKTFRYQGEKIKDFILSLTLRDKPNIIVISSVYVISKADRELYKKKCDNLLILDKENPKLLRDNNLPEYITYDRAASILAARYLFRNKNCTIIDFGNTLTIDFISSEGSYQGGNISLGCRTRIKALNRYSKSLPLINIPEKVEEIGNNFESSMSSGIVNGIIYEINGYIAVHPKNIIIFTGGDANYFAKRMKNSIFVVCNLVLMGLALIADKNVKENNKN